MKSPVVDQLLIGQDFVITLLKPMVGRIALALQSNTNSNVWPPVQVIFCFLHFKFDITETIIWISTFYEHFAISFQLLNCIVGGDVPVEGREASRKLAVQQGFGKFEQISICNSFILLVIVGQSQLSLL